jgi:DNA-binding NtrC family response regulator
MDECDLLCLLNHSNWNIHSVNDFGQAVAFLGTSTVGVVVVQHGSSGNLSWQSLLEETWRLSPSPRLIVTDRLADERMWAEVLNLGAYDLLMQPFVAEEVFRVVTNASDSWNREWHRCHASAARKLARPDAA